MTSADPRPVRPRSRLWRSVSDCRRERRNSAAADRTGARARRDPARPQNAWPRRFGPSVTVAIESSTRGDSRRDCDRGLCAYSVGGARRGAVEGRDPFQAVGGRGDSRLDRASDRLCGHQLARLTALCATAPIRDTRVRYGTRSTITFRISCLPSDRRRSDLGSCSIQTHRPAEAGCEFVHPFLRELACLLDLASLSKPHLGVWPTACDVIVALPPAV